MGKYSSHEELGANAPINCREDTTSDSYLEGMFRIAPPGMSPREMRGRRFEEKTDRKAPAKWHHNWDMAMFGGTDIATPGTETKQQALEDMIDHVKRVPGRHMMYGRNI